MLHTLPLFLCHIAFVILWNLVVYLSALEE